MSGHPHQWFGCNTYGQHGDDLVLLNIFHRIGIERPSYLDVGAHHPFDLSNTALMYERGSRGINVEPNPNLIAPFRLFRPEDVTLQMAVDVEPGMRPLYVHMADSGRNSLVREVVEEIGLTGTIAVHCTTLAEIVDLNARGKYPDLLSIDVEGLEAPILRAADFTASRPHVVCAEVACGTLDTSAEVIEIMTAKDFFLYFRAGSNLIFVREEHRARLYS